jgi:hypothetical protein
VLVNRLAKRQHMSHGTLMQLLTQVFADLPLDNFINRLGELKEVKLCACLTNEEVVGLLINLMEKRSVANSHARDLSSSNVASMMICPV